MWICFYADNMDDGREQVMTKRKMIRSEYQALESAIVSWERMGLGDMNVCDQVNIAWETDLVSRRTTAHKVCQRPL